MCISCIGQSLVPIVYLKLVVEFINYARSVTGESHYRYTDISWYVFRYLVVLNMTPEIPEQVLNITKS